MERKAGSLRLKEKKEANSWYPSIPWVGLIGEAWDMGSNRGVREGRITLNDKAYSLSFLVALCSRMAFRCLFLS